jgi:hypothetical protein
MRKSLLIIMLTALFAPLAMNAQKVMRPIKRLALNQEIRLNSLKTAVPSNKAESLTLTVNDGTKTNAYAPLPGGYAATANTFTQFVIPAETLSKLVPEGYYANITGLTFYGRNQSASWGDAEFIVMMEEVDLDEEGYPAFFYSLQTPTYVYYGGLSVANGQMSVEFNQVDGFEYFGGNLLVTVYVYTAGTNSSYNWYGVTANYMGAISTGNYVNFLPKTTFTYTNEVPVCVSPSDLAVDNITKTTADITWTERGESKAWQVVYESEAETLDVVVNGTPTCTLSGLTEDTEYNVYIRAICDEDNEEYTDYAGPLSFTTHATCEQPTNLQTTSVSSNSASMSWAGFDDNGYNVRYRKAEIEFYDGFENGLDNWTIHTQGAYLSDYFDDGWFNYDMAEFGIGNHSGDYSAASFSYYGGSGALDADNWLVTPQVNLGGTLSFYVWANANYPDSYEVLLSASGNEIENFNVELQGLAPAEGGWNRVEIDLSEYTGQKGYIAIHHQDNNQFYLLLDDFTIASSYSDWMTTTANAAEIELTNLEMDATYDVQVKAITCDDAEWSELVTFTTVSNLFVTDGEWNIASNWLLGEVPATGADVTIAANCIIPAGYIANAGNITISENGSLTIKDGGQLIHTNEGVVATMEKEINGYTGDKDNYYLIASPANTVVTYEGNTYAYTDPAEVENMLTNEYDLYGFDCTEELEWRNYKADADNFIMWQGMGYLYANSGEKTTLKFTGELIPFESTLANNYSLLTYEASDENFNGFNLVGNMLAADAYIVIADYESGITGLAEDVYFYTMGDGELVAGTGAVAPMQGVMVQASSASQVALCYTQDLRSKSALNINLSNANGLIDAAYIRFNGGSELNKIQLNPNHTKLFFTKDNQDLAVVNSEAQGELPVSFKAENNGTYTLSFSNENVTFGYLHLIDNMTGADVDLLANPSYSFEAKTTDYASRFKLVFSTENASSDHFAYFNDGSLVINNEGNATMNVYDVTGRLVNTHSINGSCQVGFNAVTGVYMIQLVNGNDVKTQKIVVK